MYRCAIWWIVVVALVGLGQARVPASELQLGQQTRFVFRAASDSRRLLSTADDFTRRLSPFDRSARLKSDRPVDEATYLAFAGNQALDWTAAEQTALATAFDQVKPKLLSLGLETLPARIDLIKTTGAEEGGAAYTRGAAIVFPQALLRGVERDLKSLLCHELFHVLSRHDPPLRERLYRTIGFEPCAELELPKEFDERRITNPDGPGNNHCIQIRVGGQQQWAVPVLYSRSPAYDPKQGGEFFDYLVFQFIAIDRQATQRRSQPLRVDGQLQWIDPQNAEGFFDKVGRNTNYVIHPDEVLADNFALIVTAQSEVASPELLARIEAALTGGQ